MSSYAELTLESLIETAKNEFRTRFDQEPEVCALAPGRINLIGDHTDYNDGYVLPMTIPRYTVIVGSPAADKQPTTIATLLSQLNEAHEQTFNLDKIEKSTDCKWVNYLKGVISLFPAKDKLPNFNALVISNVPVGLGLSSSASLEVSTFEFLVGLLEKNGISTNISKEDEARLCQKAENEWADMPCGVMDQLISVLGSEDSALLIDCRSLATEPIPLDKLLAKGHCFLIIASNVHHELSNSEYPKRRKVCEHVANLLGKSSLRDVSMKELETSANTLPADHYQKCRHVITEIERTHSASEALKNEEFLVFGTLMIQSHLSLKSDYDVTCPETDQLVDLAVEFGSLNNKNVYARQSGGGFGGCLVTLIQRSDVDALIDYLQEKYTGNTKLDFYIPPAPGVAAKHFPINPNNN